MFWRKSALHCCWGTCKTDMQYPERSTPGTYFVPFPKIGRFKESMNEWEKNTENEKTLKCKGWVYAIGQSNLTLVNRTTYISSLQFEGGKGLTVENPDPLKATPNIVETKKSKWKC